MGLDAVKEMFSSTEEGISLKQCFALSLQEAHLDRN